MRRNHFLVRLICDESSDLFISVCRWLTLAARLLRVYISTENPSSALKDLVQYVVGHYLPMWFAIRQKSSCGFGSRNLFRSIELLRQLAERTQATVRPVIQRNGYWAHPEQLLLAMVDDDDGVVREQAIHHISAAREKLIEELRVFAIPPINFEAVSYVNMISWCGPITQPPLLRDLGDSELQNIARAPIAVPPHPVHTQAVERAVRPVTEICSAVVGEEARHGLITAKLRHRQILPAINSKKDLL